MYNDFACVYDSLMDDFDYDAWSAYYLSLIEKELGKLPDRMIECACGTGNLSVRLAQVVPGMIGVDLSKAMLRQAEKKARACGVNASFVCQNMMELKVTHSADAVLATCDGVNYLLSIQNVESFFKAAYHALRPGGVLCFDCSTRYKLEEIMGNAFFGEERDGMAVLWQNTLNAQLHLIRMDVTFFVREEDGRYRRFREEHRQRAHSCQEILKSLQKCGFVDAQAYGEMTLNPPKAEDMRIHYIAKKAADYTNKTFSL